MMYLKHSRFSKVLILRHKLQSQGDISGVNYEDEHQWQCRLCWQHLENRGDEQWYCGYSYQ